MKRTIFHLCVLAAAFWLGGCAGPLERYVVSMRNHQGDLGFEKGALKDASLAYRLALQVSPNDEHAREGLAAVQIKIADNLFHTSRFDDALIALGVASAYDPQNVRLAEIRSDIEGAKVKREIVLSNYPTYKETGEALRRGFTQLPKLNARIVAGLSRFNYTYDSSNLTQAIRDSYSLGEEVTRNTNRLIQFRQQVETGSQSRRGDLPEAPAGSLLPLP